MAHPQHNFTSNFNGSEGHNAELTLNINGTEHKYTPAGNDKEFTVTGAVRIDINLDGSELAARIMTVLDGDSLPLLVQQNLDGTEDSYTYVGLQDNKWLFGRMTTTHIDSVAVSTFDGAVRRETLALASDVAIVAYNDPAVYTKLRTAVALGHLPVLDYQGTYATYVTIDNNILKFATEAADPNVESYVYTVTSDNMVTATPRNAGVVRADSVDAEPGTLIDKLEVVDNVRDPEDPQDVPLLQLETTVDGQGNRKVAINEDGLHEALDGLGETIDNIVGTIDELDMDSVPHVYLHSALSQSAGDSSTTRTTVDVFACDATPEGDCFEFEQTTTIDDTPYGHLWVGPGTYLINGSVTLQWVGNPRGTFVAKVGKVMGENVDFSQEQELLRSTTRIVTIPDRRKLSVNITYDAATPVIGFWISSLQVVKLAGGMSQTNVTHDSTLTGKGSVAEPLGVDEAKVAQSTLAGNLAPAFDPNRTEDDKYLAGESVVYEGKTYTFKVDHYGAWAAADVYAEDSVKIIDFKGMSLGGSVSAVGAGFTTWTNSVAGHAFPIQDGITYEILPQPLNWDVSAIPSTANKFGIVCTRADGTTAEFLLRLQSDVLTGPMTFTPKSATSSPFVKAEIHFRADSGTKVSFSFVPKIGDFIKGVENFKNSTDKVSSVNFSITGANITAIEKTIDIEEPMRQYRRLYVDINPCPWPVDTIGGSNPNLLIIRYIDKDGASHNLHQLQNISTLTSPLPCNFPEDARKLYIFIRANYQSVVDFKIYPDYSSLVPVIPDYKLGEIGSVDVTMSGSNQTIVRSQIDIKQPARQYDRLYIVPSKFPWNISNISGTYPLIFGLRCIDGNGNITETSVWNDTNVFNKKDAFVCIINPGTVKVELEMRANVGESVTFNVSPSIRWGGHKNVSDEDYLRVRQNFNRRAAVLPQFALVGDLHGVRNSMRKAVNTLGEISSYLNFALVLGDITHDYPTEENAYTDYQAMVNDFPVDCLPVIGNHDKGSGYCLLHFAPNAQVVENVMGPAITKGFIPSTSTGYYCKDFSARNIRVIVLNLYENDGEYDDIYDPDSKWERVEYDSTKPQIAFSTSYGQGDIVNVGTWTNYSYKAKASVMTPASVPSGISHDLPCYSVGPNHGNIHQTQAQWLADTLLSTPANYSIIIAGHTSYSTLMDRVESNFSARLQTNEGMHSSFNCSLSEGADIIADIINAFNNGVNTTLSYTRGSETISVVCSFSTKNAGVKYIGYMAGHLHYDVVTRHQTYTDQYSVHACAAINFANVWTDIFYVPTPRLYNNYTIVAPSRSDGGVNLIKIGLKMTDDGYLRDCARITQTT